QTKYMGTTGNLNVTAAAHGSVYKYAIDRWGNIRPDFAAPHRFQLDLKWPGANWKSQKIVNGLPVSLTRLENGGQTAEIEQYAARLDEHAKTIRGDIPSVMLSKVRISGGAGPVNFTLNFGNAVKDKQLEVKQIASKWMVTDKQNGEVLLLLESDKDLSVTAGKPSAVENGESVDIKLTGNL